MDSVIISSLMYKSHRRKIRIKALEESLNTNSLIDIYERVNKERYLYYIIYAIAIALLISTYIVFSITGSFPVVGEPINIWILKMIACVFCAVFIIAAMNNIQKETCTRWIFYVKWFEIKSNENACFPMIYEGDGEDADMIRQFAKTYLL